MGPDITLLLCECWVLTQIFHSFFHFHQEVLYISSLFAIRVISSKYLGLLIFLPAFLIHACASSSMTFSMLYTTYELWMEVCDIVQGTGIKIIHKKKIKENNNTTKTTTKTNKKTNKKAKHLSEKALQRTVKRRQDKSKGEKERFIHFNAEFQRISGRVRTSSSAINAKK